VIIKNAAKVIGWKERHL